MGRILRLFPGKEDGLILDYAPVEARDIIMAGDVLGAPLKKESYIRDVEAGEEAGGFTFDQAGFKWMQGDPAEIIARELDYFNMSPWRWHRKGDTGWSSLGLGTGDDGWQRTMVLSPPSDDGDITLYIAGSKKGSHQWQARQVLTGALEEVRDYADRKADEWGDTTLAMKEKAWRDKLPSEGQLKFAKRLHIKDAGQMSRGALSAAISHELAMQAVRCV